MAKIMSEISYPDELLQMLKPGESVNVYYKKKNRNNQKRHILAIIEDEQIVYKYWSISQGWIYKIEWIYVFLLLYNDGNLKTK